MHVTLSASCTSQICSPVDGLYAGNTFPLTESCHSLLMKICGTKRSTLLKRFSKTNATRKKKNIYIEIKQTWFSNPRKGFPFMTLLFKLTAVDFKAAEQNLNWQVITRCFRPVVSFHDALLATVTCLHSSLPDSGGRDMGESLEIWTEIPACPALLSGECSTIQTKGVGLGGGRLEWERMGWGGEINPYQTTALPPSSAQPHVSQHRCSFTRS